MHPPAHALFDSAWPMSFGLVLLLLLVARLLFYKSKLGIIFWLPLFLCVLISTLWLAIALITAALTPSSPGTFSPLAFAGPVIVAVILGILACIVAWLLRPVFQKLSKQHWISAIIAVPVTAALLLFSPTLFSKKVIVHCEFPDDRYSSLITLQRMQENEVVPVDDPVSANAENEFIISLNSLESFTARVSSPGFETRTISFFPHRNKGFWLYFSGPSEPQNLPLGNPGIVRLSLKRVNTTEQDAAANP